jgi:membrane protein implicated in regulation of membrane protease activity
MNIFIDFIRGNPSWFWFGVMIICIIIETWTFTLTTIWFACGALAVVFISMTGLPFRWQLLIFIAISCTLLILTRPLLLKKLQSKKSSKTNVDALIGQEVPVIKAIGKFEKGRIKYNGTFWPAAGKDGMEIAEGIVCTIVSIQGNTVTVAPVNKSQGEKK